MDINKSWFSEPVCPQPPKYPDIPQTEARSKGQSYTDQSYGQRDLEP